MRVEALGALRNIFAPKKDMSAEKFFLSDLDRKNQVTEVMFREGNNTKVIKKDVFVGNKRQTSIIKYDFSQNPVMTTIFTKTKNFLDGSLVSSYKKTEYQYQQLFGRDLFSEFFKLFDKIV